MLKPFVIGALLGVCAAVAAHAHGDGAPSPFSTEGLPNLKEEFYETNPYRGNALASDIGTGGYNQNCARCHGLDVKSGGMAPDLRDLPNYPSGDQWFYARVSGGASRDGRVRMPPFGEVLSPEAIWAIRTYVETRPKD